MKESRQKDEFFLLQNDSPAHPNYAWATALVPSLSQIGERCDVCGNGHLYPDWYPAVPLRAAITKGRSFPDILGCGEFPFLIVSERVLTVWSSLSIRGFTAYPFTVDYESNGRRPPAPQYFHLKVTGRCEMDTAAMGITVVYRCPKCRWKDIKPITGYPKIFKPETWDGTDLFASDLFPMAPFCTSRLVELAKKHRWTNFHFADPMVPFF